MRSVVGDAIAVLEKVVDLLRCPRLAVFEESKELLKLVRRELRGAATREARSKSIDPTFVPGFEPASTGWLGRTDTSSGHFVGVTERDVLDETESPDETE